MRHGSLFSGIGGFDLASEWMGWENVFHCEWMEFPRKVLDYYWPNADSHIDICKTDFKKYANKIDILTGGFPCQPFSTAGKRKGTDDERYLWGEMLRAVQEIKPKYVIAENVFGITNIDGGMVFEQVCLDLEAEGYEVQPFIIPAAAKNAPHRRDRCWFIAYSNSGTKRSSRKSRGVKIDRRQNNDESFKWRKPTQFDIGRYEFLRDATNSDSIGSIQRNANNIRKLSKRNRFKTFCKSTDWTNFPTQSPIYSGDDGLPTELDGITFSKWRAESIKGYGNAIVPQIAFEIFQNIKIHITNNQ
jgi:DNA (cytosine-5)-methyltransferase 1